MVQKGVGCRVDDAVAAAKADAQAVALAGTAQRDFVAVFEKAVLLTAFQRELADERSMKVPAASQGCRACDPKFCPSRADRRSGLKVAPKVTSSARSRRRRP